MKIYQFRTSRRWTMGLVFSALTFAAVAHAGLSSVGSGESKFIAEGPAGLTVKGKGTGVSASEAGGVLTVSVPLTNLDTEIDLRNEHLKKALNVAAHPKATLEVKRSDLKFPENNKSVEASGKGKMKLNGVSQPTAFDYKVTRTGSDYHVEGKATIDITKHKIELPCYLGACVEKDVKVKVTFKLRDK